MTIQIRTGGQLARDWGTDGSSAQQLASKKLAAAASSLG